MGETPLMNKLLLIEKELLAHPSFAEKERLAIKELESRRSLIESCAPNDREMVLETDDLLYSWPLLKRKRALVAALVTTAGFAGLLLFTVLVSLFFGGVRGLVSAIALLECSFHLYHKWRYHWLNAQPKRHEPKDHNGWVPFNKFLELAEATEQKGLDIHNYLSVWFRGAPVESIKSENVMDLLAYGFWYKTRQQLDEEGHGDVPQRMLDEFERVFGLKFPKGRNFDISFLAHLWEPLRSVYRPLLFYLLTEFSGVLAHNILKYMGFAKSHFGAYTYFTFTGNRALAKKVSQNQSLRKGKLVRQFSLMGNPLPDPIPIVFLHGVGLGILPYLDFVCSLVCTGHPVVIVEYRHVAMRLCWRIPSCSEVADNVMAILDRVGVAKASFVSHSYGTFVLSRIVKTNKERVQSACFIDPVCVGMFLPKLLNTFVYLPACMDNLLQFMRDAIRMAVSRELGITASMCRNFAWSELNLWPDDLEPSRSLIVFSGKDGLVPNDQARQYFDILAPEARIMYHPKLSHGEFLALPDWKLEIIQEILSLANADLKISQEEAEAEEVVRKTSLVLSVGEMANMENPIMNKIGLQLETRIARTLSMPWQGL